MKTYSKSEFVLLFFLGIWKQPTRKPDNIWTGKFSLLRCYFPWYTEAATQKAGSISPIFRLPALPSTPSPATAFFLEAKECCWKDSGNYLVLKQGYWLHIAQDIVQSGFNCTRTGTPKPFLAICCSNVGLLLHLKKSSVFQFAQTPLHTVALIGIQQLMSQSKENLKLAVCKQWLFRNETSQEPCLLWKQLYRWKLTQTLLRNRICFASQQHLWIKCLYKGTQQNTSEEKSNIFQKLVSWKNSFQKLFISYSLELLLFIRIIH